MSSWIKNLLTGGKLSDLELENKVLREELQKCNEKVVKGQEAINKTNAYWKSKMYAKNKKEHKNK